MTFFYLHAHQVLYGSCLMWQFFFYFEGYKSTPMWANKPRPHSLLSTFNDFYCCAKLKFLGTGRQMDKVLNPNKILSSSCFTLKCQDIFVKSSTAFSRRQLQLRTVCVCVCTCERERERELKFSMFVLLFQSGESSIVTTSAHSIKWPDLNMCFGFICS